VKKHWIDVQVGTDFSIDCDCGWSQRTKSSEELYALVDAHTEETGHRWPTEVEAAEIGW